MMNFMKAFDMQRYDFLKVDENCGEGGGEGEISGNCWLQLLSYSMSAFLITVDDTFVVILPQDEIACFRISET